MRFILMMTFSVIIILLTLYAIKQIGVKYKGVEPEPPRWILHLLIGTDWVATFTLMYVVFYRTNIINI